MSVSEQENEPLSEAVSPPSKRVAGSEGDAEPAKVWLNLDQSTGFHLNTLSNRFSLVLQSYYRSKHGLNVAGWRIIATLAEKAPMSAREVAEYTVMDPIRISRSVSDLLKRKLVSRRTDPNDRRRVILRLTSAGYDIYHDVTPWVIAREKELYGTLSDDEAAFFLKIVKRLEALSVEAFGAIPQSKFASDDLDG